jgi:predicted alpha/beta superfamily hydrolase
MKAFTVYGSKEGGVPLIVLNTFQGEGQGEWEALQKLGKSPLLLVVVHDVDWDAEMTPYPAPSISKNDRFLGKGENHLRYLKEEVLPSVIKTLANPPLFYGIAGYSLAGLFACSTLFWDSPFTRIASASGSLWYPGFLEFAESHEVSLRDKVIALSLGDKESAAKNPVLSSVGEKTQAFASWAKKEGASVSFSWNPGSHFAEPELRTAKAILQLL